MSIRTRQGDGEEAAEGERKDFARSASFNARSWMLRYRVQPACRLAMGA